MNPFFESAETPSTSSPTPSMTPLFSTPSQHLISDQEPPTPNSQSEKELKDEQICYGPNIRIHRYDVGTRMIQFLVLMWLLSGFSFLTCVCFCIFVNVGYVTFRSRGTTFLIVVAFAFFSVLLFKFYRSLCRTFIRMGITVWKEKFGAGKKDFILLRWMDHLAHFIADRTSNRLSEKNLMILEYTKTIFLCLFITGCIGVPLIYTATEFGYYAIINVLCAVLTIGSALLIIVTNLISRLFRFLKYLRVLFSFPSKTVSTPARIRAAYVASTENDHGRNILNVFFEYGIFMCCLLLFCSFVFTGFRVNQEVILISSLSAAGMILFRFRMWIPCYHRNLEKAKSADTLSPVLSEEAISIATDGSRVVRFMRTLNGLEWNGFYRGHNWHHVLLIFSVRAFLFFMGFFCLVYLDMTEVKSLDGKSPVSRSIKEEKSQELIFFTLAFYAATLLKDIVFFVPVFWNPLRPFMLIIMQLGQVFLAFLGRYYFNGFTFMAAILLSVYEMNYREAKWFWTGKNPKPILAKNQIRAMRNTFWILILLLIFLVTSILCGMLVGTFRSQLPAGLSYRDLLKNNQQPAYDPNVFHAPICSMRFTKSQLSIIDLAIISDAAYQPTKEDAEATLRLSQRLNDWHLKSWSLDNSSRNPVQYDPVNNQSISNRNMTTGVRFIEVENSENVSVVAIRGTFKLEDVFQDAYLWSTPALLQFSSYFGTFVNAWPIDTVARVNYIISALFSYPNLIYWGEMEDIIRDIITSKDQEIQTSTSTPFSFWDIFRKIKPNQPVKEIVDSKVLITGHSLGGGLASIVASHLSIPGIVFSAPGLGYSLLNYNLTMESVMTRCLNVIPLSDPVAAFDKQISMVQNIPCAAGQPGSCHSLKRTVKTLMDMCGYA